MREYYRWEHKLPLLHKLNVDKVGHWIAERESLWDQIEEQDYQPLSLGDLAFDPFEHDQINQYLIPHDLVYSAGVGRMGQPHFALSRLIRHTVQSSTETYECGAELARDSVTVPAMARGRQLFIRRDGIRRYLWEMYDDWYLNSNEGPMADIVSHYNFTREDSLDKSLESASDDLVCLFSAHERGEVMVMDQLGQAYSEMTMSMAGYRAEFYVRAARDLYADALSTWPLITARGQIQYLDFWLAALNGVRLQLLDHIGLRQQLCDGNAVSRLACLRDINGSEIDRWKRVCLGLLEAYQSADAAEQRKIDAESIALSLCERARHT